MARSALVFMLLLLPAMAMAYRSIEMARPLVVHGKVLCDSCRADFETSAISPISDVEVTIVCRDRVTEVVTYMNKAVTKSDGCFTMFVNKDQGDNVCNIVGPKELKGSCPTSVPGRESALVVLTRNNGMSSNERFTNSLLYKKLTPDANCEQVMQQYKNDDEQY